MEKSPTKPSRWLKITLAISLGLNFLVIGAVGGAMLHNDGPRKGMREMRHDPMRLIYRTLPQDTRKKLRKDVQGSIQRSPQDQEAWVSTFIDLLRVDSTNEEALKAHFSTHFTQMERVGAMGRDGLVAELLSMKPDVRSAFAEKVEKAWKTRKKHGGKKRGVE